MRAAAAKVHNPLMFDWNDLKYFLAVARHGSTIAAGKALGLSQSTVHRRLEELERQLGRALVTRQPSGYRLTEFGHIMLPYAERIEVTIDDFQRRTTDVDQDMKGAIRVTCPEPIVARLIQSGLIDNFHAMHPSLRVEFVMSDRYLDLSKGEVDVAFRSGDTDDELVGRKLAESIWAVYASRDYQERHGTPERVEDLARHLLVGLDESLGNHRAVKWLKEVAPDAKMAARINSVLGLVSAIKSGVGIGPLPIALGDAEADLVRVLGPIPELTRSWRILTHPDLRRVPRISAFFDFIVLQREALKPILTG
ncbi:LysR family transcriptional regulator [Bradyrhizobium manausense]|uniref:LysR family transcriptional regulator n=1 Tax=Bradyrhizobium TaxID=374 RepID=UPI001BAA8781|nr:MULTISPECIES: LysR family transcriptional regulator [Bradyrhizobium]MBR0831037.1 LysR family transcriptional regulator [Bradyrhizobium manausense]UVO30785.1 LysR family transcriptional regulator [Bradyrhizobium arachidis]